MGKKLRLKKTKIQTDLLKPFEDLIKRVAKEEGIKRKLPGEPSVKDIQKILEKDDYQDSKYQALKVAVAAYFEAERLLDIKTSKIDETNESATPYTEADATLEKASRLLLEAYPTLTASYPQLTQTSTPKPSKQQAVTPSAFDSQYINEALEKLEQSYRRLASQFPDANEVAIVRHKLDELDKAARQLQQSYTAEGRIKFNIVVSQIEPLITYTNAYLTLKARIDAISSSLTDADNNTLLREAKQELQKIKGYMNEVQSFPDKHNVSQGTYWVQNALESGLGKLKQIQSLASPSSTVIPEPVSSVNLEQKAHELLRSYDDLSRRTEELNSLLEDRSIGLDVPELQIDLERLRKLSTPPDISSGVAQPLETGDEAFLRQIEQTLIEHDINLQAISTQAQAYDQAMQLLEEVNNACKYLESRGLTENENYNELGLVNAMLGLYQGNPTSITTKEVELRQQEIGELKQKISLEIEKQIKQYADIVRQLETKQSEFQSATPEYDNLDSKLPDLKRNIEQMRQSARDKKEDLTGLLQLQVGIKNQQRLAEQLLQNPLYREDLISGANKSTSGSDELDELLQSLSSRPTITQTSGVTRVLRKEKTPEEKQIEILNKISKAASNTTEDRILRLAIFPSPDDVEIFGSGHPLYALLKNLAIAVNQHYLDLGESIDEEIIQAYAQFVQAFNEWEPETGQKPDIEFPESLVEAPRETLRTETQSGEELALPQSTPLRSPTATVSRTVSGEQELTPEIVGQRLEQAKQFHQLATRAYQELNQTLSRTIQERSEQLTRLGITNVDAVMMQLGITRRELELNFQNADEQIKLLGQQVEKAQQQIESLTSQGKSLETDSDLQEQVRILQQSLLQFTQISASLQETQLSLQERLEKEIQEVSRLANLKLKSEEIETLKEKLGPLSKVLHNGETPDSVDLKPFLQAVSELNEIVPQDSSIKQSLAKLIEALSEDEPTLAEVRDCFNSLHQILPYRLTEAVKPPIQFVTYEQIPPLERASIVYGHGTDKEVTLSGEQMDLMRDLIEAAQLPVWDDSISSTLENFSTTFPESHPLHGALAALAKATDISDDEYDVDAVSDAYTEFLSSLPPGLAKLFPETPGKKLEVRPVTTISAPVQELIDVNDTSDRNFEKAGILVSEEAKKFQSIIDQCDEGPGSDLFSIVPEEIAQLREAVRSLNDLPLAFATSKDDPTQLKKQFERANSILQTARQAQAQYEQGQRVKQEVETRRDIVTAPVQKLVNTEDTSEQGLESTKQLLIEEASAIRRLITDYESSHGIDFFDETPPELIPLIKAAESLEKISGTMVFYDDETPITDREESLRQAASALQSAREAKARFEQEQRLQREQVESPDLKSTSTLELIARLESAVAGSSPDLETIRDIANELYGRNDTPDYIYNGIRNSKVRGTTEASVDLGPLQQALQKEVNSKSTRQIFDELMTELRNDNPDPQVLQPLVEELLHHKRVDFKDPNNRAVIANLNPSLHRSGGNLKQEEYARAIQAAREKFGVAPSQEIVYSEQQIEALKRLQGAIGRKESPDAIRQQILPLLRGEHQLPERHPLRVHLPALYQGLNPHNPNQDTINRAIDIINILLPTDVGVLPLGKYETQPAFTPDQFRNLQLLQGALRDNRNDPKRIAAEVITPLFHPDTGLDRAHPLHQLLTNLAAGLRSDPPNQQQIDQAIQGMNQVLEGNIFAQYQAPVPVVLALLNANQLQDLTALRQALAGPAPVQAGVLANLVNQLLTTHNLTDPTHNVLRAQLVALHTELGQPAPNAGRMTTALQNINGVLQAMQPPQVVLATAVNLAPPPQPLIPLIPPLTPGQHQQLDALQQELAAHNPPGAPNYQAIHDIVKDISLPTSHPLRAKIEGLKNKAHALNTYMDSNVGALPPQPQQGQVDPAYNNMIALDRIVTEIKAQGQPLSLLQQYYLTPAQQAAVTALHTALAAHPPLQQPPQPFALAPVIQQHLNSLLQGGQALPQGHALLPALNQLNQAIVANSPVGQPRQPQHETAINLAITEAMRHTAGHLPPQNPPVPLGAARLSTDQRQYLRDLQRLIVDDLGLDPTAVAPFNVSRIDERGITRARAIIAPLIGPQGLLPQGHPLEQALTTLDQQLTQLERNPARVPGAPNHAQWLSDAANTLQGINTQLHGILPEVPQQRQLTHDQQDDLRDLLGDLETALDNVSFNWLYRDSFQGNMNALAEELVDILQPAPYGLREDHALREPLMKLLEQIYTPPTYVPPLDLANLPLQPAPAVPAFPAQDRTNAELKAAFKVAKEAFAAQKQEVEHLLSNGQMLMDYEKLSSRYQAEMERRSGSISPTDEMRRDQIARKCSKMIDNIDIALAKLREKYDATTDIDERRKIDARMKRLEECREKLKEAIWNKPQGRVELVNCLADEHVVLRNPSEDEIMAQVHAYLGLGANAQAQGLLGGMMTTETAVGMKKSERFDGPDVRVQTTAIATKDVNDQPVTKQFVTVQGTKNNAYQSRFYYTQSDITKMSDEQVIMLAAKEAENFNFGNPNKNLPITLKGNMHPRLAEAICAYCAVRGYQVPRIGSGVELPPKSTSQKAAFREKVQKTIKEKGLEIYGEKAKELGRDFAKTTQREIRTKTSDVDVPLHNTRRP